MTHPELPEPSWRFAETNGGAEQSNNPGQVTFADDPIHKATRELLQNSLDHAEPGLETVKVTFTLTDLPARHCRADQLAQHAYQAAELLIKENDPKAERYKRAYDALRRPVIKTLAVVDRNTTGCSGDKWRNLIYREGKPANAQDGHGGSYGFGKNAPFNLSDASAILYSTSYIERAARGRIDKMAGRAQFISHPHPETGAPLQAIGFYGHHPDNDWNQPLLGSAIPEEIRLSENGTGLYILAFRLNDFSDWVDQIATAVVTDFFPAVQDNKLQVEIQGQSYGPPPRVISKDTLSIELEKLPANAPTRFYHQAYTQGKTDQTVPSGRLGGMGPLNLYTLAQDKAPRRLVHINRHGMFITEDRVNTSNPFYPAGGLSWSPWCALTQAADPRTEEFLRASEPPAHNALQYRLLERTQDQENYKEEYRCQREQIAQLIRQRIDQSLAESGHNIRELAALFPDLPDADSGSLPVPVEQEAIRQTETEALAADAEEFLSDSEVAVPTRPHGGTKDGNGAENGNKGGEPPPPAHAKPLPAKAALPSARALRVAPNIIKVALQMPNNADAKGVTFALRQAGEQWQPFEERIALQKAEATGSLAAKARLRGDTVQATAEPGAEIVIALTLTHPAQADAGYQIVQVND